MKSPQQPPPRSLNSSKDLLLSALPPLKAALKVLSSPTPIRTLAHEKHSWYGLPVALCLIMVCAMMLILSSDGAPFIDPWTSLWTFKFEFNVMPSRNWPVLLRCAGYALSACAISYGGSILAGFQLNGESATNRHEAIMLAGYASIGAAFLYVVTLLLIFALGWLLYLFKFRFFIFSWMLISSVVLLPATTWGIAKIFRRTSLPRKLSVWPPLTISLATVTMCAIGAIFIMDSLNDALVRQGHMVSNARNNPTAAVIQACSKVQKNVICAVTLFPTKWQDYELIGDWKLGAVVNPSGIHQARFFWHPFKEKGHEFALVNIDARKDSTIEIGIDIDMVCTTDNTSIRNDDQFFAVQGRVRGEQHNAPQEMRVRVDNTDPTFANIMTQVCQSQSRM